MSNLYKLVYDTFTSYEEFLTARYSHLYQSSSADDQDKLKEKLDHLLDHRMRENELMEKTQGDTSSSEDEQERVIVLGYTDWEMD